MILTIRKYILLWIHDQGFENCSNMQYFFMQFVTDGSESNCHRKQIDVSLISSGANLK